MPRNCWTCQHFPVGSWNEPCHTCTIKTPHMRDGVLWAPRVPVAEVKDAEQFRGNSFAKPRRRKP